MQPPAQTIMRVWINSHYLQSGRSALRRAPRRETSVQVPRLQLYDKVKVQLDLESMSLREGIIDELLRRKT